MPKSAVKQLSTLRSCAGVLSRLAYARARREHVKVGTLLRQAGLTLGEIENKDTQLSVTHQIKFVELVAKAVGDSHFGFHLACTHDLRESGLLYYVAASADSLGEALLRMERYSLVVNEAIKLRVKKGRLIRVTIQYVGVARHTDMHQIEFWIASLIRLCRHLTKRDLKPIRVRLMHRRTGEINEIAAAIDGHVEAGSNVDEVDFPIASWDYPVVTADPYLHRLSVRCCEQALARRETRASALKVTVENAVAGLLPHGQVRIDIIAKKLGMSPRTLARRLSSEGWSFAGIVSDLRSALAHRYLADQTMSISQISWFLGYAETSTFTRAFQRWTGKSPSAARAQQRRSRQRRSAGRARRLAVVNS